MAEMIELTRQYGRYGYLLPREGRIGALLRGAGWLVNDKRVERLCRRERLKVPIKQPRKGRLWLNDGSCVRFRPEYRNQVSLSAMQASPSRALGRTTLCTIGQMTEKRFEHLTSWTKAAGSAWRSG